MDLEVDELWVLGQDFSLCVKILIVLLLTQLFFIRNGILWDYPLDWNIDPFPLFLLLCLVLLLLVAHQSDTLACQETTHLVLPQLLHLPRILHRRLRSELDSRRLQCVILLLCLVRVLDVPGWPVVSGVRHVPAALLAFDLESIRELWVCLLLLVWADVDDWFHQLFDRENLAAYVLVGCWHYRLSFLLSLELHVAIKVLSLCVDGLFLRVSGVEVDLVCKLLLDCFYLSKDWVVICRSDLVSVKTIVDILQDAIDIMIELSWSQVVDVCIVVTREKHRRWVCRLIFKWLHKWRKAIMV